MNGIFVNALLFQIANTFHCIVLHIICLGCIVSITAFSKQLYVQSVAIAYANVPYERQCSQIHGADSLRYAGVSDLEKKWEEKRGGHTAKHPPPTTCSLVLFGGAQQFSR